MKKPVNDALVAEFAKMVRSGGPLSPILPFPFSKCEFTDAQKLIIKEAWKSRDKLHKAQKSQPSAPPQPPKANVAAKSNAPAPSKPVAPVPLKTIAPLIKKPAATVAPQPVTLIPPPAKNPQSLKKLERMLYLQGYKCFFCGETLALADASIEHLLPLSKGGTRTEDNEVVCHKSLNGIFGDLELKRKFEFVIKASGSLQCPGHGSATTRSART